MMTASTYARPIQRWSFNARRRNLAFNCQGPRAIAQHPPVRWAIQGQGHPDPTISDKQRTEVWQQQDGECVCSDAERKHSHQNPRGLFDRASLAV